MSNSNEEPEYEADKGEQEENKSVSGFDEKQTNTVDNQNLHKTLESSDCENYNFTEEQTIVEFSQGTQLDITSSSAGKVLRKKDSTGVRWVDWEGVAEISEKKELDSPTDDSLYSDERVLLLGNKDNKAPPILPLAVEQVKLDKLLEASTVKQPDFEEDESDSDLISPEGKDTLLAHGDIIKERYDIVAKMKLKHQIEQENPFRPEGELSKEANEIVDAIQSGNCKKLYATAEGSDSRNNDLRLNPDSPEQELEKLVGGSVSECDIISRNGDMTGNTNKTENAVIGKIIAKESLETNSSSNSGTATVEVHKGIIAPSQTQDVSIVVIPEKKSGCCNIL